jgi:hypothetical protein
MRSSFLALLCLSLLGCDVPELDYTEVKRIEELVTDSEFDAFLAIAGKLPGGKLPVEFNPFLPPPDWSPDRTLPVSELVDAELQRQEARWSPERMARTLPDARQLERLLRRHRITREQFTSLGLVLGATLSADSLPASRNLAATIKQGEPILRQLKADHRLFATLSDDEAYQTLLKAGWISLFERAQRLQRVIPANLELVRRRRDELVAVLPPDFNRDPLAEFAHLLDQTGLPFTEQSDSGYDDDLSWTPASRAAPANRPAAVPKPDE